MRSLRPEQAACNRTETRIHGPDLLGCRMPVALMQCIVHKCPCCGHSAEKTHGVASLRSHRFSQRHFGTFQSQDTQQGFSTACSYGLAPSCTGFSQQGGKAVILSHATPKAFALSSRWLQCECRASIDWPCVVASARLGVRSLCATALCRDDNSALRSS